MPAILIAVSVFIAQILTSLVNRVLAIIGFGVVNFVGINLALDALREQIDNQFSNAPTILLDMIGLLSIDIAISLILSAYIVRATLSAAQNISSTGSFRRRSFTGTS